MTTSAELIELFNSPNCADPPPGMLICDAPPGRIAMIFYDGKLSPDVVERLRAQWDEATQTGRPMIFEKGFRVQFAGSPGWPDWEFCAA